VACNCLQERSVTPLGVIAIWALFLFLICFIASAAILIVGLKTKSRPLIWIGGHCRR
jgi:hypothetical protein